VVVKRHEQALKYERRARLLQPHPLRGATCKCRTHAHTHAHAHTHTHIHTHAHTLTLRGATCKCRSSTTTHPWYQAAPRTEGFSCSAAPASCTIAVAPLRTLIQSTRGSYRKVSALVMSVERCCRSTCGQGVCVCVRVRVCERECVCVCVCVHAHMRVFVMFVRTVFSSWALRGQGKAPSWSTAPVAPCRKGKHLKSR